MATITPAPANESEGFWLEMKEIKIAEKICFERFDQIVRSSVRDFRDGGRPDPGASRMEFLIAELLHRAFAGLTPIESTGLAYDWRAWGREKQLIG